MIFPVVSAESTLDRDPLGPLKLLADGTRLRILALLESEELSVGELSRALGMAQSRVSNHLRLLREAGLLAERHAGSSTYLRLATGDGSGLASRLWTTLRRDLEGAPERSADLARLAQVLAERRGKDTAFFDHLAGEWNKIAGEFETGQGRQRAAAQVLSSPRTIVDVGCGTGYMAGALDGLVERLILVDSSAAMLREAERRFAPRASGSSVETRVGEVEALPLDDGEVDGAVAGMVLHHLVGLDPALSEVLRVLRPGGSLVVLELFPHREEWMRAELGDRYLGLEPGDVLRALARAGFEGSTLETLSDRYRPRRLSDPDGPSAAELPLYLVRASKPLLPSARPPHTEHAAGRGGPLRR